MMKYAEELEKAGLHKAVSCIVRQFPHLEKLAEMMPEALRKMPVI